MLLQLSLSLRYVFQLRMLCETFVTRIVRYWLRTSLHLQNYTLASRTSLFVGFCVAVPSLLSDIPVTGYRENESFTVHR